LYQNLPRILLPVLSSFAGMFLMTYNLVYYTRININYRTPSWFVPRVCVVFCY
jgi:hypothetical protein